MIFLLLTPLKTFMTTLSLLTPTYPPPLKQQQTTTTTTPQSHV
jgi:hypothetical protein